MALNVSTFKTRTLTAAVFVVVMLAGLLWNHWSFLILFSIIHFGCWIEYQKLVAKIDPDYSTISPAHKYGVILAGWGLMLFFTNDLYLIKGMSLRPGGLVLALTIIFSAFIADIIFAKNFKAKCSAHSVMGLLYISIPMALIIDLRTKGFVEVMGFEYDYGWVIPMVMIASIWINDTMAYIVGSFIGKTPFSKISPNKTWEGTIGGAVLAIVVVTVIMMLVFPNEEWWPWTVIAAIASFFGTLGDLFESKLKRLADVKDSGHIMPGHGGFLDRFDSLLFAIPFVWLFVYLFY